MKTINYKNSLEEVKLIKEIMNLCSKLDIEYLKKASQEMRDNLSFKQSAMILNPNQFTAIEKNKLQSAQLRQLELMIELAENYNLIKEKTLELCNAISNQNKLSKFF